MKVVCDYLFRRTNINAVIRVFTGLVFIIFAVLCITYQDWLRQKFGVHSMDYPLRGALKLFAITNLTDKNLAFRSCLRLYKGLQIRGHRFEFGTRLHRVIKRCYWFFTLLSHHAGAWNNAIDKYMIVIFLKLVAMAGLEPPTPALWARRIKNKFH